VCSERELSHLINSVYGIQSGLGSVLNETKIDIESGQGKVEEDLSSDLQITSLKDMAGETPVVKIVNYLFGQAVQEKASDIHLSPQQHGVQLRYRIDGKLIEMPSPPQALFLPLIARIKILANMDITVSRVPQDGRLTVRVDGHEINVRVSTLPTIYGENMVLRLLDTSARINTLNQLGMGADEIVKIEEMIQKPYGMILATGPTGSGKTTSLYAILNKVNKPDINIITLEDPVEFRVNNLRQVQLNTKAGMTFASGLRSVLRQDPNVIMVGEIRDGETARIAVQAAQTGHRLLSTVHTNDAAGAITRLMDMGIEPFLIASVLLVSIAQRLVRTVCPYCHESYIPPEKILVAWGMENIKDANFQRGRGCNECLNTGYKGRTGIYEVLVNDDAVKEMILRKSSAQEITKFLAAEKKMRTLKENAVIKIIQGITTIEEAASAVMG
jgi:type IV pilus assembly protein PilB